MEVFTNAATLELLRNGTAHDLGLRVQGDANKEPQVLTISQFSRITNSHITLSGWWIQTESFTQRGARCLGHHL